MTYQLTIGGTTKRSRFTPRVITVDWENLPEPSRDFIIRYGLKQYLSDGTAGAESQNDFDGGIADRLDNLQTSDFRRASGEKAAKPDTPEGRAIKLAKADLRARLKAAKIEKTAEEITAAAKLLVEKQPQWLKEATRQIESEKKLAAEAAGDESEDVLAELFGKSE